MCVKKIRFTIACLLASSTASLYGDLEMCNLALDRLTEVGTALRNFYLDAQRSCKKGCSLALDSKKDFPFASIDSDNASLILKGCEQCDEHSVNKDISIPTLSGIGLQRYYGQLSWQIRDPNNPTKTNPQQQQGGRDFVATFKELGRSADACKKLGGTWLGEAQPPLDNLPIIRRCLQSAYPTCNVVATYECEKNAPDRLPGFTKHNICVVDKQRQGENLINECNEFQNRCCSTIGTPKIPCDKDTDCTNCEAKTWRNPIKIENDWLRAKQTITEFLTNHTPETSDQVIVNYFDQYKEAANIIDSFIATSNRLLQLKICKISGHLPKNNTGDPSKDPMCCYGKSNDDTCKIKAEYCAKNPTNTVCS